MGALLGFFASPSRQRGFVIPPALIAFGLKYGLYIVAGIAALAVITFAVRHYNDSLRDQGRQEIQAKWDKAVAEQRDKEQAQIGQATTKLEDGNAKAKVVYRTITRSVDKYIDRPIYRNVCLDADGLRDANAALRGPSAPAGKLDTTLPGSDAARGRDGSNGVAEANRER